MGAFKSAVITKKGQELLAKVVAGTTKLGLLRSKYPILSYLEIWQV